MTCSSQGPINFLGASVPKFVPTEAPIYWVEWVIRPDNDVLSKEMDRFRRSINRRLAMGYMLLGGICTTVTYGGFMIAQAMVKSAASPRSTHVHAHPSFAVVRSMQERP